MERTKLDEHTSRMPHVVAWLVGSWLILAVLTGSAWGTLTLPDGNIYLLGVGDSQTITDGWPHQKDEYSDPGEPLWDGSALPWIIPNREGVRETSMDYWNPFSTRTSAAGDSSTWVEKISYARKYAFAGVWTHQLADNIGTPYWATCAVSGALLYSASTRHPRSGLYDYFNDNPYYDKANVVTIHIGINSAKTTIDGGWSALDIANGWRDVCRTALQDGKVVLLLVPQPLGGYAAYDPSGNAGRVAKLDSMRALGIALRDTFATAYAQGKFDVANPWRHFVTNADGMSWSTLEDSLYHDSLKVKFNDDYIHMNVRGNRFLGNILARDHFGCDTKGDASDTLDFGDWIVPLRTRPDKTIYVNDLTGDNANQFDPFSPSRPLATIQQALMRASPGDVISLAPQEYGDQYPSTANDALTLSYPQMFFWWEGTHQKPITIEGNGATFTNPQRVSATRLLANFSSRYRFLQDSLMIANLVIKDLTISGYNASDGSEQAIILNGVGGVTLENIDFVDCVAPISMSFADAELTNIRPTAAYSAANPCSVTVKGCTFDNLKSAAISMSGTVTPQTIYKIQILNNTCVDTTGDNHAAFVSLNRSATTGGLTNTVAIVGNTVLVDSMATNNSVISLRSFNKSLIANNLFDVNHVVHTSTYFRTRGLGNVLHASGDSLLVAGNIIELTAPHLQTSLFYTDGGSGSKEVGYCNLICQADADSNWASFSSSTAGPLFGATTGDVEASAFLWERQAAFGGVSDTLYFGFRPSYLGYSLQDYGLETGTNHASIGPTQYAGDPILWTGNYPGRETYQDKTPWKILQLINNGVLSASDSLDADTWYEVPRVYNESEKAVVRSWMDAWENWPDATRKKIRLRFSSCPMKLISPSDSTYAAGPWGALKHIVSGGGTVSDSLDASTWYQFTRPYNHTDELQIEYWLRTWKKWPDATRKKIRFRVQGTDLSLLAPDGTSYDGLWALDEAITNEVQSASDSLSLTGWFLLPRVRDKDFAQATQARIYLDALATWPDAKRKRIRVATK